MEPQARRRQRQITVTKHVRRSLVVLATIAGMVAATLVSTPTASAATLSGFEIDGDRISGNDGGFDWDSPVVAGNYELRTDPCQARGDAANDDIGSGGSKITNEPPELINATAPEFADLCLTESTYFLDGADVVLCIAWERSKAEGTNSYFFEINQSDEQYANGIPVRLPGDVLIEFDDNANDTQINYRLWDGTNYPNTGTFDDTWTEAALSADQLFGEACINLSQTVFDPGVCINFGQMWMFSVSGGSLGSRLFEVVLPRTDIGATSCGTIGVAKTTQPAGADEAFTFELQAVGTDAAGNMTFVNLNPNPGQSDPVGDGESFGNWDTTNDSPATGDPSRTLLLPGQYVLSEINVPDGWQLTEIECTEAIDLANQVQNLEPVPTVIDAAAGTVTVNLDYNEHVTCGFTNAQVATIDITKITDPPGAAETFDITFSGNGTVLATLPLSHLSTGQVRVPANGTTYSIAEILPAGWALDSIVCDDGIDPTGFLVEPGQAVACTVTNVEAGNISILKLTDPPGAATVFTFDIFDGGGNLIDTVDVVDSTPVTIPVAGGSVSTVVERTAGGWEQIDADCGGQDPAVGVSVPAGDTITCTFTNALKLPELEIVKTAVLGPDGDCSTGVDGVVLEVPDGATVTWCVTVTNVGEGPATGVTVADDQAPGGLVELSSTTLAAAGGSANGSYDAVVSGLDLVENIATVNTDDPRSPGEPFYGPGEEPNDDAQVQPAPLPTGLALQKAVVVGPAGDCPTSFDAALAGDGDPLAVELGDTVTWCLLVQNTGGVDATSVVLTDAQAPAGFDGAVGTLAPSETAVRSFDLVVTLDLPERNTATAAGQSIYGPIPPVTDTAIIDVANPMPSIFLSKTVVRSAESCDVAIESVDELVVGEPGEEVLWCYVITNDGNVALTDLLLTDPDVDRVDQDVFAAAGFADVALAVNESVAFAIPGIIPAGGEGSLALVTAAASTIEGEPLEGIARVDAENDAAVIDAAIELDKTVVDASFANCTASEEEVQVFFGVEVTWCFEVTNIGSVNLLVTEIYDDRIGVAIPIASEDQLLEPGETIKAAFSAPAEFDVFRNTATVVGVPVDDDGVPFEDASQPTDEDTALVRTVPTPIFGTVEPEEPDEVLSTPPLAVTGSETTLLLSISVMLGAIGGALLVGARRRLEEVHAG